MNRFLLIEYEVGGSWFTPWLPFKWMHNLAASYFAAKIDRKLRRLARYRNAKLVNGQIQWMKWSGK